MCLAGQQQDGQALFGPRRQRSQHKGQKRHERHNRRCPEEPHRRRVTSRQQRRHANKIVRGSNAGSPLSRRPANDMETPAVRRVYNVLRSFTKSEQKALYKVRVWLVAAGLATQFGLHGPFVPPSDGVRGLIKVFQHMLWNIHQHVFKMGLHIATDQRFTPSHRPSGLPRVPCAGVQMVAEWWQSMRVIRVSASILLSLCLFIFLYAFRMV